MDRRSHNVVTLLRLACLSLVVAITNAQPLRAGFVFTSLDLRNTITDTSGGPGVVDTDRITTATNPFNQTSIAQVGMNIVESTYAFQWNEGLGTADFDTNISHAMRSREIRTVTSLEFFLRPTEDLHVTVEGSIDYAHTPGDDTSLFFGMSVRDFATQDDVFREIRQGGNAILLPSAGTLAINGEAILNSGTLYRLRAVFDNNNWPEPNPGNLDASGFANFSIRPIPEPTAIALLTLPAALLIPRRQRRARSAQRPRSASQF